MVDFIFYNVIQLSLHKGPPMISVPLTFESAFALNISIILKGAEYVENILPFSRLPLSLPVE